MPDASPSPGSVRGAVALQTPNAVALHLSWPRRRIAGTCDVPQLGEAEGSKHHPSKPGPGDLRSARSCNLGFLHQASRAAIAPASCAGTAGPPPAAGTGAPAVHTPGRSTALAA